MNQESRSNNEADNDAVDSMEEREVLWELFISKRDCSGCPRGKSSYRLMISACLRCFEKYLESADSKGGPDGF